MCLLMMIHTSPDDPHLLLVKPTNAGFGFWFSIPEFKIAFWYVSGLDHLLR